MIEAKNLFNTISYIWLGLAVFVFVLLFFIAAPYGRHARRGWGPMVPARWAWLFMEMVSPLVMFTCLVLARHRGPMAVFLALLWIGHYLYRAFIFPFLLNKNAHPMPLIVVFMSVIFNLVNAGLNGLYLFFIETSGPSGFWFSYRFVMGLLAFFAGFAIHFFSDRSLVRLRKPGETGYKIPKNGLFELVSAPNYFGELMEWTGWAIMAWNLPAFTFMAWTAANLIPRAITNHRWYKKTFPDYPKQRKAIIPFIL